jgi:hypothetical protein
MPGTADLQVEVLERQVVEGDLELNASVTRR